MTHTIEAAKSGRASCRTCKKPIVKGDLRLGEAVINAFSAGNAPSYHWHHLSCAAQKRPLMLEEALQTTAVVVFDRAYLEREIAANRKNQQPDKYPYAERAKTSRSSCLSCTTAIEQGTLRVAVERDVDRGAFVAKGAGYLHGICAGAWLSSNSSNSSSAAGDLLGVISANSPSLDRADLDALKNELAP